MNLFRYPGGKTKLQNIIVGRLFEGDCATPRQYREPFFGGGSMGLAMLSHSQVRSGWINDKDPGIAALWTAVARYPAQLIACVERFCPSVKAFDNFKGELLKVTGVPKDAAALVDIAFKKLAIHQISFSGLGTMSGGPLGGRMQLAADKIDSRWSPRRLCQKIAEFHERFAVVNLPGCTCLDFAALIEDRSCPAILYLDPPYVVQGDKLYQCGFGEADHIRLAELLRKTPHPWVLSYDDCPLVRDLYSWAQIEEVAVGYSVSGARCTSELVITPQARTTLLSVGASDNATSPSYALAS